MDLWIHDLPIPTNLLCELMITFPKMILKYIESSCFVMLQSRFPQINNPPKKQLLLTYWYILIYKIHFLLNIIKLFYKETYFCDIQNVHGFKGDVFPTVTYMRLNSRKKIPSYFSCKSVAENRLNSLFILNL